MQQLEEEGKEHFKKKTLPCLGLTRSPWPGFLEHGLTVYGGMPENAWDKFWSQRFAEKLHPVLKVKKPYSDSGRDRESDGCSSRDRKWARLSLGFLPPHRHLFPTHTLQGQLQRPHRAAQL